MLTLAAILTALVFGYALLCAVRPFGVCRRCKGAGKRTTWFGGTRSCRRCKGGGLRLRVGRRIHLRASALHRAGTR